MGVGGRQTTSSTGPGSQRADDAEPGLAAEAAEGRGGRARTLPGSSHSPWPCRARRSALAGGDGARPGGRAGRREAAPGRRSQRAPPETPHGCPAGRGDRSSPPRPDAQRARAPKPAVRARARGMGGATGRDVCGGGSYGRGGPHVPKDVFPWGSLMPITGSMRCLDSLGESGAKRSLDSGAPLSGFSEPTVLGGWGFLWPCPTQPRPRRRVLWERWAR